VNCRIQNVVFSHLHVCQPGKTFIVHSSINDSFTFAVWIFQICSLPASSGSPISMCTSKRPIFYSFVRPRTTLFTFSEHLYLPGRSKASSSMSKRLVIPMIKMLFSCSTPSICSSG
jgi:hypothetical protein